MTEKSNQSLTKRGFNLPHVFDGNIIILLIVYALVLGYEMWALIEYKSFINLTNYYEETCNLSQITFTAGLIISLVQFRFLQVKTKCITILSLGESRKSLFRKKFWFPLLAMVLMTIGFYIVLLCTDKKLKNSFSILSDEYFANILIALLTLIVGYTVGAFARIVSGKTSESIFFGISISALPFAFFNLIDGIFALSLRGYYTSASEWESLSGYITPVGQTLPTIFSLFDPLYTLNTYVYGFENENLSTGLWFETPAFYIIKNLIWICIFVGLIFAIEKYFIKKFKAESCNKSGKNKIVRIICSLSPSLLATALMLLAFYQATCADVDNLQMVLMLILTLIAAFIGTLVVTMVLYRKTEQLKYSFLGVGITSIFCCIIAVISVTGCFGYSTYIPETDKIKSVRINDSLGLIASYSWGYLDTNSEDLYVDILFETDEEIQLAKDIHKFIANDRDYETTDQFTIIYELENGNFINRTYPYLSKASCEKISSLWETATIKDFYRTIFNQNPEINSESTLKEWFEWTNGAYSSNGSVAGEYLDYIEYKASYYDATDFDTIAKADSLVVFSKDSIPAYITDEQVSESTMAKLKKALYEDYMNMSAQQFYKPEKQFGVISLACSAELIEYKMQWWYEEDEKTKPTSESVLEEYGYLLYKFPVTSDMKNTIKVLKDADLYKHFFEKKKVEEAHLIDSQNLLSWFAGNNIEFMLMPKEKNGNYLSAMTYSWEDYNNVTYLVDGCGYTEYFDEDEWDSYPYSGYDTENENKPIPESDIQKIIPEEAEKLREKAFMTYNAGNDCKFLVMKYTDGTANMLVIPN